MTTVWQPEVIAAAARIEQRMCWHGLPMSCTNAVAHIACGSLSLIALHMGFPAPMFHVARHKTKENGGCT